MNSHTFDQRSWRLIKDFSGIYGIKMDYTKIAKLSKDKISKAYFDDAKLPLEPFEVSIVYRAKYNQNGRIISLAPDTPCGTQPFDKSVQEWKTVILKKAAQGYKNREFYEALAKLVAPPPKVTCVCGLKIGATYRQKQKHYQTKSHINRMLKCVPVSSIDPTPPPHDPRVGNCHTICLKRLSHAPPYIQFQKFPLLPIIEQRESMKYGSMKYGVLTCDEILMCLGEDDWTLA